MSRLGGCTLALLAALSTPALADRPLPPPQNWQQTLAFGTAIDADVAQNQVTIRPTSGAPWTLPFYARAWAIHPSPDGRYVLVSNNGANLLGWDGDPDMTVLRLYEAPGVEVGVVPLRALMRPRDMQRTVSHYLWIHGYTWADDGWEFATPDAQTWRLGADLRLIRR